MTKNFEQFRDLASSVADDPDHWQDVLNTLCQEFGATATSITVFDPMRMPLRSYFSTRNHDDLEALDFESAHYNPRYRPAPRLLRDRSAKVVSDRYTISRELADRDRWYQERARPLEMYQWLGGIIPSETSRTYCFNTQKGSTWVDPSTDDIAEMKQVLWALKPAIELVDVIQNHSVGSVFDFIEQDTACALLGWRGRVAAMNQAFETLLAKHHPVAYSAGNVIFNDDQDQCMFSAMLTKRLRERCSFITAPNLEGVRHRATVFPFRRGSLSGISDVLIVEQPRMTHSLDRELIKLTFSLSPTELEVAVLLFEGNSTEEISISRSVKLSTTRTQVLSILEKVGVENRQQLIGILQKHQRLRLGGMDAATGP